MAIKYGTFQYGRGYYGGELLKVSPNQITCNNYIYSDSDILSGSCHIEKSLAGDELSIDTLDATVNVGPAVFTTKNMQGFQTSNGDTFMCANPISGYAYGDEVRYEHDGLLIGKFFFEKSQRMGQTKYEFSCVSAMGLLDGETHYGGIYDKVPAGTIIADIMRNVSYTINPDVVTILVSGWLPVATRRENLQQVLFAIGSGAYKDSNGKLVIGFYEPSNSMIVSSDRIYIDGTVDYQAPCNKANVTEHTYNALSSDTAKTLFSTSDSVSFQTVLFNAPCHDLAADGLSIEKSGVNYAIVSGIGTLTGKEYTHTQKIVSYVMANAETDKTASVTDATLVSSLNSYDVAVRVAQYYSEVSMNSVSLVVGDERPGTEVIFTNPFGDTVTGSIKSMDITMSATLKADAEIAVGFLPASSENAFKNYALLTGNGVWNIPEGVKNICVILVGAGDGGDGGDGGKFGDSSSDANKGGAGGYSGRNSKLFKINLAVSAGNSYTYSCGTGGTGGNAGAGGTRLTSATTGTKGTAGTETTFGSFSSANGTRINGYTEPKSGLKLCDPGTSGVPGGESSHALLYETSQGIIFLLEAKGNVSSDGKTYLAGKSGTLNHWETVSNEQAILFGGFGGGAAVGSNGGNATDYYISYPVVSSGRGGDGATATLQGKNASTYGGGGSGGHGGGGGGYHGYISDETFAKNGYTVTVGDCGNGGSGSSGGKGGDGCIVIYY